MRKSVKRMFGQAAIGRDLAAVNGQKRRLAIAFVEGQDIVAGYVLCFSRAVIVERANARERPNHVGGTERRAKVLVRHLAEIGNLVDRGLHAAWIAGKAPVRGSNQREIPLERQREHDPPVVRLNDIGAIVLEQTSHHDVAALVEPRGHAGRITEHAAREQLQPRPSGVDQDASGGDVAAPPHVEHKPPYDAPFCPDAAGAGTDYGAAL